MHEPRVVVRRDPATDKVGLVVGWGSGHEPAFSGYVGVGMADAAACGNVFASPIPNVILSAIRAANHGRGVLFGVLQLLGRRHELRPGRAHGGRRRDRDPGAGARKRVAAHANASTRSIGVALSACEVLGSGRPTFELGDDKMEIGMGVQGEPGITRGTLRTADEVAQALVDGIVADPGDPARGDVALLVNGLGATAYSDQYILFRAAHRALEAKGLRVVRPYLGEFIASLEMAGASVTGDAARRRAARAARRAGANARRQELRVCRP